MDKDAVDLSAELAAQLAENDIVEQPYVDPKSIPTRFSLLKQMAVSPAHYRHACQQPQDDSISARLGASSLDRDKSAALRFGSAVHYFLLGDPGSVARYTGRRDPRAHAYKAFVLEAEARGAVVVLTDFEYRRARAVADAIRRNETAMELLFDGTVVEERIDWTFVGRACRSTPDARSKTHVADLKTTYTAEPAMFHRHAERLFYHAQAWLYAEALEETTGIRPSASYVIAVEKTAPFPVSIFRFTERTLEIGEKLCRVWIERLNVCEATDSWPEYLQAIADFDIGGDDGFEFGGQRFSF